MNLVRVETSVSFDKVWLRKLALIAFVSPVPLFGQLWALGYANLCLSRMVRGNRDTGMPEVKLGWELCWRGIRVMLVMMMCALAVALVCSPFFAGRQESTSAVAPAMVQALQGPSTLLAAIVLAVITGVALVRFALTDSIAGAVHPGKLWTLPRAEPSIWISYAAAGFVATEGPYGLAWVLPLHGGWDVAATIVSSTVLWVFGLMFNTYLLGRAFGWARRTAALRSAHVGYRW